jgi:tetratricopeptide (TPR) repeat protein
LNTRGYLREAGDWLRQLLEGYHITDTLHARSLAVYASSNLQQGNFPETLKFAEQSLELARALSDDQTEALSLSFLGVFTLVQGNVKDGIPLLEEALAIYRSLGDKIGQADTAERLAISNSDIERAIAYAKESLELSRELGNLSGIAACLILIARTTIWKGNLSSPAPWLKEALSICRQIGNHTHEGEALQVYGTLAFWQGDYQQATAYYQESLMLSEKTGNIFQNLWSHIFMAYAIFLQGDIQKACEMFEVSIQRTYKAGLTIALVFAIEGLASLYVNQKQLERAVRLFAWADAMREKIGDQRPPVEQKSVERDMAVIRSKLSDSEFENLSTNGRTMSVEQAVALALEK